MAVLAVEFGCDCGAGRSEQACLVSLFQDPGEHGRQYREALLQWRHLPAADGRVRGIVQAHPHWDLRMPRPRLPASSVKLSPGPLGLASHRFASRPPSKCGWMSVEVGGGTAFGLEIALNVLHWRFSDDPRKHIWIFCYKYLGLKVETLFQDLLGYLGTFRISATLFMELSLQHVHVRLGVTLTASSHGHGAPTRRGHPLSSASHSPVSVYSNRAGYRNLPLWLSWTYQLPLLWRTRTVTVCLRQAKAACVWVQYVLKACVCKCVHTCPI